MLSDISRARAYFEGIVRRTSDPGQQKENTPPAYQIPGDAAWYRPPHRMYYITLAMDPETRGVWKYLDLRSRHMI